MILKRQLSKNDLPHGTLIAIPIDENRFALSQIYVPGIVFYLLIYDTIGSILKISQSPPKSIIMSSWTNDAEIFHDRWKIIGRKNILIPFKEPEYKIFSIGIEYIESFDGHDRRPAGLSATDLSFRTSRSPALVSKAVRAFYGFSERDKTFEKMLYKQ